METINEYKDSTSIEMLALALVREYLSRKVGVFIFYFIFLAGLGINTLSS